MKHPEYMYIIGLAMLVIGFTINYIIARRKFNRRSITGLEEFKSFEDAWLTKLIETFGSLVAKLFILIGIFILVLSIV